MIGGRILGKGAFNTIKTLDDVAQGTSPVFFVDTFDIMTGSFNTISYPSRKKLLDIKLRDQIVIREISNLYGTDLETVESNNTGSSKQPLKDPEQDCLTKHLFAHWNSRSGQRHKKPAYTIEFIESLLKNLPEWLLLWRMFKKGIFLKHHAVGEFLILHTDTEEPTVVTLCIRTDSSVFPVYRLMSGDIESIEFVSNASLFDLLNMVESVLLTLVYYSIYGMYHHIDIKPRNILFDKKDMSIMLADYESSITLPGNVPIIDIIARSTDIYTSPLFSMDNKEFSEKFKGLKTYAPSIPESMTSDHIWSTWRSIINEHVKDTRETCDLSDFLLTKNDLYALGCSLLSFGMTHPNKMVDTKIRSQVVELGLDLMRGCSHFGKHDNTGKKTRKKQGIATISEAARRLAAVRNEFSDEELREASISMSL